jgi:NAD(P)-dependent dehydrogenase (short-subunit alcohol dehydrogenase family)
MWTDARLLADKVALVTGAAAGIGEGVARLFAAQGAKVFLVDRDEASNVAVAESIAAGRGFARTLTCDVRDRVAIDRAVATATAEFGHIDILVNNAGIYPRHAFLDMTEEQWDEIQDINLKSMFYCLKAVVPGMVARGRGRIVNISSVVFFVALKGLTHYAASKGGVIGLTRTLARELGEHDVHVNCITPGAILVESERKVATPEQIQAIVELQSLKRRLLPEDIARACLFFSSELSDGITGQTLNVDGGWVMH